jgi:hypothetical protein
LPPARPDVGGAIGLPYAAWRVGLNPTASRPSGSPRAVTPDAIRAALEAAPLVHSSLASYVPTVRAVRQGSQFDPADPGTWSSGAAVRGGRLTADPSVDHE